MKGSEDAKYVSYTNQQENNVKKLNKHNCINRQHKNIQPLDNDFLGKTLKFPTPINERRM